MFLLDTNVVYDLRRTDKAPAPLLAWSRSVNAHDLYISCITLFELELGVRLRERRDAAQGRVLRQWLETRVVPEFEGRVLDIDATIARRCAVMHVPNPAPERDAWIAATALVHGLTVVSRNTRDFAACGAQVLNPWQAPV